MPIIGALPFTFTNNTVADADQVNADFNAIVEDVNNNAAPKSLFPSDILSPLNGGTGVNTGTFTEDAVCVVGATGEMVETPVRIDPDTGQIRGFFTTFNDQIGTSYTINPDTDGGKSITLTNGSSITVTLPNDAPVGFYCEALQLGAGTVTFDPDSGATLISLDDKFDTAGQGAAVSLRVVSNSDDSSAVWVMTGATA